jgi:sugar fermentation stimulation protein A
MEILKNTIKAKFIKRPNRFKAYVDIDGHETMVHVPNTGRCKEILLPGSTVILREEPGPLRKTAYDLIAGYKGGVLINIDSQIPNKVIEEALYLHRISGLISYDIIQREKTFGNSRFDFKLTNSLTKEEYYLEVKGVTYEIDGTAKFPDAPTERGAKHLMELVEVKNSGRGAGVLFLIQLSGVRCFSPYDDMDEAFGKALRYAKVSGVDVFCYDSIVEESSITLNKAVEVKL